MKCPKRRTFGVSKPYGYELAAFYQIPDVRVKSLEDCNACGWGDGDDGSPRLAMERDHRFPRARGGTDSSWNIQLLCLSCHQMKSWLESQLDRGHLRHWHRWLLLAFPEMRRQIVSLARYGAYVTGGENDLPDGASEFLEHATGQAACCGCEGWL